MMLSCNTEGKFFLDKEEFLTTNFIEFVNLLDFFRKNGTGITTFLRLICILDKIIFTFFRDNFKIVFESFFFFFE